MVEDFLSEEAQLVMKKKDKIAAFAWVFLGGMPTQPHRYFRPVTNMQSLWNVGRWRVCLGSCSLEDDRGRFENPGMESIRVGILLWNDNVFHSFFFTPLHFICVISTVAQHNQTVIHRSLRTPHSLGHDQSKYRSLLFYEGHICAAWMEEV